jgi:NO-binding membrane sensor protein with MHYT domain
VLPAVASAGLALRLVRSGGLRGRRLWLAGVLLGFGIAAMHHTGMAAVQFTAPIRYETGTFVTSPASPTAWR